MAKTYTVARTVVFYFETEADSAEQALIDVDGLGMGAAFEQQQITQEVIHVEETV